VSAAAEQPRVRSERSAGRAVLVVEGDDEERSSLCELLRSDGYAVGSARDGRAALGAADSLRPDVILLEPNTSGLHGLEVCRRLRARYGFEVAIIFVSGTRTEPYDRIAGLDAGGDDYLVKPFDPGELLARVGAQVRRLHAIQQSDAKSESPLTARQEEIVALLAHGADAGAIAARLYISQATVRKHLERIHRRLGTRSRSQVVAWAYESGLATDPERVRSV
jgi:DNA-binding response OmpR family regulator